MVTNIPLAAVSHISLFNKFKRSAAEKIVLLRHLYRLDALDISKEDLIPLPDTSATPQPYLPSPNSEKLKKSPDTTFAGIFIPAIGKFSFLFFDYKDF